MFKSKSNPSLNKAWSSSAPACLILPYSYIPPQPGNLDFNIKKRQRSLSTATVAKLNYTQLISYAELGSTHPAFTTILLNHKKMNTLPSNYWAAKCWSKLGSALPQLVLLTLDAKQKENLYKNKTGNNVYTLSCAEFKRLLKTSLRCLSAITIKTRMFLPSWTDLYDS